MAKWSSENLGKWGESVPKSVGAVPEKPGIMPDNSGAGNWGRKDEGCGRFS